MQISNLGASVDNEYCYDLKALQFFRIKFVMPAGVLRQARSCGWGALQLRVIKKPIKY
jgi:hypothetical protein